MSNNVQEQYFKEIKRFLSCGARQKEDCIAELQPSVNSFIKQTPDATLKDLYNAVGNPQAIAESYLKRAAPPSLPVKYKLAVAIAAACVLLLIIISIMLITDMIDFRRYIRSYVSNSHACLPVCFSVFR